MKSVRSFIFPFVLLAVAFSSAVVLQHRMIDHWRKMPRRFRDTLYLPSSEYVRVISLGYNHFTADFLWLRMIQVFAAAWSSADNPAQIKNYCDVITDLDPHFQDPYDFAIMAITEARAQVKMAETTKSKTDAFGQPFLKPDQLDQFVKDIVDKSVVRTPGHYQTPYQGALFAFITMNDPQLAKFYAHLAKADPNYPTWIDRWEGNFEIKQGRYVAAFQKFLGDYITSIRNHNKDLYEIHRNQLNRALNSWIIDEIKKKALERETLTGKLPTMEELIQAGAFQNFEYPVISTLNDILAKMHEGVISTQLNEEDVYQLSKHLMRKWTDQFPPGPYDVADPRFQGYVIWAAKRDDPEQFILSRAEAIGVTQHLVISVFQDAQIKKKQNGVYPGFSSFERYVSKTDPFGKPWIYDMSKGVLKSATYPDVREMAIPILTGRD